MSETYTYAQFVSQRIDYSKVSCFLLLGADSYLLESAQLRIRKKLIETKAADLVLIYGDEATAGMISEHLDEYSVFSESKLILIRSADFLKKEALEAIARYLANPDEEQSLIIICTKPDLRVGAWKKIKDASICVQCDPPKHGGEVRAWLDAELKIQNRIMQPVARDEFLSRIELDYSTINNELNKLFLLTKPGAAITVKDIDESLGTTRTGALADFYRALGSKDAPKAIGLMNSMIASDWEPLGVLSQIQRFFMTIWKIQLLQRAHISSNEIIAKHMNDIFLSYRKDYLDYADRYKSISIKSIFESILEADSRLKLTQSTPEILLSICLLQIMKPKSNKG